MIPAEAAPVPHPFNVDADGIDRTPGPDKHPYYARFAASGSGVLPVVRQVGGEWLPALLICRYDDVREVLRRQDLFSRATAAHADQVDVSGTMLGMDGAEHAKVRGTVKDSFTKPAVSELRDTVRAAAEAQLAVLVAKGGRADLVGDFAVPFGLNVISDLLGLPEPDRAQFRRWGDMFMGSGDLSRAEAARSAEEMGGYLWQQLDGRRGCPSDDLMTRIATAAADQPVDVQVKLPLSLIVGGWETTASSISTFVYLLRTRPYAGHDCAWDHLLQHPEQVDGAVAELERLHSTSNGDEMPRRVMADVTLPSGARLTEGDIVIPSHDAANRDPRVFTDPERMDFGRDPNPHLSFGYGPHYCIGAHLGALEVRVALALLLRELPGLRLAVAPDEVRWKQGHAILGPVELPVTW
ncbi:Cytochrome P450 [Micromonospora phaseoli]|uniref:Cytochrome P450 n=1 Tax=Micromonospora phaseoli TaxID=1144548 RepID=A0A1H7DKM2_9ACTN|nr:cytochrome P450 [Micromonospora phaseoli]PZV90486.1 cytochrome P450 [Micromonospora phaseoli]GIJ78122.1 cytochrome P450 [Micromonospora phaseoli]SEK00182.1 Cytochrome P450 [Micromonospora phaseoli]